MKRMRALSRLLAMLPVALLLSNVATAQATRTVGAGQQYTTIQAAIDAANPGDTVAVHAGSYATFLLTKSLTVRAEPLGAVVEVNDPVFQVPAGGHARIAGLRCLRSTSCYLAGLTSFEQCEFLGVSPYPNVLVQDGSATFWRCRVADGIGGIRAIRAHVSIVQTDITCAAAGFYLATMSALRLDDSHAHISSSTLTAGRGFDFAGSWPGILALGSSILDVVDSTVTGADYTGTTATVIGAPAIRVGAGSVGRHWRCVLTPGTTANGAGLASESIATPLLGCTVREPALTPGSSLTADFRAEPTAAVLVVAAFGLATPAATPFVQQMHWGFTAPAGQVLALAFADSQGQATHALGIPASPIFLGVGVWLTGAELGQAASIVLSPPVGGVIR